jgi:hypothetical protein
LWRVTTIEILNGPKPAGQAVHRPPGGGVAALAPDQVVGGGVEAVEGDLDVEVVHRRQATGRLIGDEGPVVENFTPMSREMECSTISRVAADGGLATADVDVEDLEVVQLVEHGLGLGRGQLAVSAA